jgi:1-deoxy-D-xylulose-5-phosphate reductoisomerase
MLLPVQLAMSYPERWPCDVPRSHLPDWGRLEFEEPDHETFPAIRLARRAVTMGGTAPAILNAADEVAVAAFLDGRIRFPDIIETVESVLDSLPAVPADSLAAIVEADRQGRESARSLLAARSR